VTLQAEGALHKDAGTSIMHPPSHTQDSDNAPFLRAKASDGRTRGRLFAWAFGAYALLLFTMTHWPKLKVPGPEGSDKVIHMTAFGTWCVLGTLCGWFGPRLSKRNILVTSLVALVYAGVDEWLQKIPFINRQASWADYAANAAGVVFACVLLLVAGRLWGGGCGGRVRAWFGE
jgi:VanZ family protein